MSELLDYWFNRFCQIVPELWHFVILTICFSYVLVHSDTFEP